MKREIVNKRFIKIIAVFIAVFHGTPVYAWRVTEARFKTISRGQYSHYGQSDHQQVIEINNAEDWQAFWKRHVQGVLPSPPLPEVDFTTRFVLVAMDEVRGSGGYGIEIKEIKLDPTMSDRPFEIILQLTQPGSAAGTIAVMTRPYHIVEVEK